MDVGEFINVKVGDFDVLSMSELNYGSNSNLIFEPAGSKISSPLHESDKNAFAKHVAASKASPASGRTHSQTTTGLTC